MAIRRAAPVILATAGGLALLASFHTTPGAVTTLSAAPATAEPATTTTTTPTTTLKRSRSTTSTTTVPVRSLIGPTIQTRFGPVQVRLTIQGTRILDVAALQLPASHPRSIQISQQAEPLLRSEVLQAQSAHINVLSGASYTSVGYAESAQRALDTVGVA